MSEPNRTDVQTFISGQLAHLVQNSDAMSKQLTEIEVQLARQEERNSHLDSRVERIEKTIPAIKKHVTTMKILAGLVAVAGAVAMFVKRMIS